MSLGVCRALYTVCYEMIVVLWLVYVVTVTVWVIYSSFIVYLDNRYIEQPDAPAHPHNTDLANEDQAASDTDPDVLACRYCRVNRIAVVYRPCGHALCCRACATHQQRCMYCSSDIGERVYMVLG